MPEEQMGLIQGQVPDSLPEWYVALALERLEVRYMYKFVIYGTLDIRGSIEVDFVVWNPWPIPAEVFGRRFHNPENDPDTRLRLSLEEQYFGRQTIVWWDDMLEDQEMAYSQIKKDLGL